MLACQKARPENDKGRKESSRMIRILIGLALLPLSSLAADLDSYVNAYYLAEHRLSEFDQQLAQEAREAKAPRPGILGRSRAYRDLLALRILMRNQTKDISAEYRRLSRGSSSELLAFHDRLNQLDPAERLALNDLVMKLPAPAGRAMPVFYANTEQFLSAKESAGDLIDTRIRRALRDKNLLRQVEELASTAFEFGEDLSRASRIRPGTGPEGTINGSRFPESTFALTLDDGPHPTRSEEIFASLKAHGKKATFFWVVEHLERFPLVAPKALAAGLPLNNHSWTHPNLAKASAAQLRKEITESSRRQKEIYGEHPQFFRLPYGAGLSNQTVRRMIADNGMIHVLWNVDSLDWQEKDPAKILTRVKQLMSSEKKGIILFHDLHAQSVEAVRMLLDYSASVEGGPSSLRWVTIPEIVEELNKREESRRILPGPALKRRAGKNPVDSSTKL